jgi:NAD(P)-dependent dehydrogenase (short-subunit alcohol dehydrogenase family)
MKKDNTFLKQVDFTGKRALITGASRGIGESIAVTLASLGAEVILVSRKIEGLKEVENKIIADGGKAVSIPCNIGNMEEIDGLFKQIREKFDKIDILVNNSATNPFFGSNLDATESAWEKTFSVNLKGYFFMTQQAAKIMKEKGGGSIVNISSVNGIKPAPMQGMYSITKAGVISMTKSFAKELAAYNIRVNAVLPGMTDTKFSAAITQNPNILDKFVLPSIPMSRIAQPDEMAGAVVYLVSDAASFTTGSCIIVDGGMLA